jgi:hypothetical protein
VEPRSVERDVLQVQHEVHCRKCDARSKSEEQMYFRFYACRYERLWIIYIQGPETFCSFDLLNDTEERLTL